MLAHQPSLSGDNDTLPDLDCDVDDLLDTYQDVPSHPHRTAQRASGLGIMGLSQSNASEESRYRAGLLSTRRNTRLCINTSRLDNEGMLGKAKLVQLAPTARDSLSPEPLTWKRYDRLGSPSSMQETEQSNGRFACCNTPPTVLTMPDSAGDEQLYNNRGAVPSSAPPARTNFEPASPITSRRRSRFSAEQRGAFLRANRDQWSATSASPKSPFYLEDRDQEYPSSAMAGPQQPEASVERPLRPRMPPRSLLGSERSLGSFFEHEGHATEDAPGDDDDQTSTPIRLTVYQAADESTWQLASESPMLTNRVRSSSVSTHGGLPLPPRLSYDNTGIDNNGLGIDQCNFEQYENTRGDTSQYGLLGHTVTKTSSSSSTSSKQTRGPFILTTASSAGTTTPELVQDDDAAQQKAEQRVHAELVVAKLFANMDLEREREVKRRAELGPEKPRGFFGLLETTAKRQANFELAWDRLCEYAPDDEQAVEDRFVQEQKNEPVPSMRRRLSIKVPQLKAVKKKLLGGQ